MLWAQHRVFESLPGTCAAALSDSSATHTRKGAAGQPHGGAHVREEVGPGVRDRTCVKRSAWKSRSSTRSDCRLSSSARMPARAASSCAAKSDVMVPTGTVAAMPACISARCASRASTLTLHAHLCCSEPCGNLRSMTWRRPVCSTSTGEKGHVNLAGVTPQLQFAQRSQHHVQELQPVLC